MRTPPSFSRWIWCTGDVFSLGIVARSCQRCVQILYLTTIGYYLYKIFTARVPISIQNYLWIMAWWLVHQSALTQISLPRSPDQSRPRKYSRLQHSNEAAASSILSRIFMGSMLRKCLCPVITKSPVVTPAYSLRYIKYPYSIVNERDIYFPLPLTRSYVPAVICGHSQYNK